MNVTADAEWEEHQDWEAAWWGNCANTMAEEMKQIIYASRMGLENISDGAHWPYYNLNGCSVLDIGGGPVSLLLKTHNGGRRVVVDPCVYPDWVRARYDAANIEYIVEAGEYINEERRLVEGPRFDEAWIYNVLQHTDDPLRIIRNAQTCAKKVRLFEWIDIPAHPGHPQELKANLLSEWLGGFGTVEDFRSNPQNGCNQIAFYGVFNGY
jgi:2-polyprenyl-3-methyl-5-hydroxy-6-metoxy-1,4-benzoquinol methylase